MTDFFKGGWTPRLLADFLACFFVIFLVFSSGNFSCDFSCFVSFGWSGSEFFSSIFFFLLGTCDPRPRSYFLAHVPLDTAVLLQVAKHGKDSSLPRCGSREVMLEWNGHGDELPDAHGSPAALKSFAKVGEDFLAGGLSL